MAIYKWIYPLKMVIVHSYVSLPEGILVTIDGSKPIKITNWGLSIHYIASYFKLPSGHQAFNLLVIFQVGIFQSIRTYISCQFMFQETRYLNLILNKKMLKLPCTDKKWKRFHKRPSTKPVQGNPWKDGLISYSVPPVFVRKMVDSIDYDS